tara:strand:+ start:19950 stop:21896 length:1947 start_codon:yes stop_codon:yes gene_type:complete
MEKKILIVEDQFIEANYLKSMLENSGYKVCGIARSYVQAKEFISQEKPSLVLVDILLTGNETGIDLAKYLNKENIAFVYLSANSNVEILQAAKQTRPYGFLVKPFREKDLLVTLEIAEYLHENSLDAILKRELELQKKLTEIISDSGKWDEKLLQIGYALQPHIPFDFIAAGFNTIGETPCYGLGFLRTGYNEYQRISTDEILTMTGLKMPALLKLVTATKTDMNATFYNNEEFELVCKEPSLKKLFAQTFKINSYLALPLVLRNKKPFSFCLYSKRANTYNEHHISTFKRIQTTLNNNIGEMLDGVSEEIINQSGDIPNNAVILQASKANVFDGIIGKSHLLLEVFDQISQVAPTTTSVLILGESGTGKERIADCVHNLSPRNQERLVKVNCATIPHSLVESELFGHEKGSFTGALEKRIGKFEQAHNGTIFLDEIGEMPLEIQVKLLRVLQEKEIERIGSKMPSKIDIRIIAATNRNLEKEVAEGRFRLDLYYRLNVFPITLPSLRKRIEDIPELAYHFMNYYNRKSGKKISGFSDQILNKMMKYHWPGNIRELEHLIERSVLTSKSLVIQDLRFTNILNDKDFDNGDKLRIKTIQENEREYIISILKKCNGRIWGARGAAELLNIPPSTLKSKMIKLGIKKEYLP